MAHLPQSSLLKGRFGGIVYITASSPTKKREQRYVVLFLVGLPGFEPRMTGPESVVLPLHHSPMFVFDGAKVEQYFEITKDFAKKMHIFVKIFAI